MWQRGSRFGAGSFSADSHDVLWRWLSDSINKNDVQIQLIKHMRILQGRTRFAVLRDAVVSAKRNSKWILKFNQKSQTCKIMKYPIVRPHGALWKTPRSRRLFLSVVAKRNGKCTRIFALIERQSSQKTHKNQNHEILHSTATCDSVEVAPERAPFQRIVTKRVLWLWLSDYVYKKDVQIQLINIIRRL